jgi:hypothetical protein
MRILLFMLLFSITAAGAFAALDEQYIVVVGKNAPSSDVVIAANFAASMKATLGVTFAPTLDEDANKVDFSGKTVVVIDGRNREVKIFGTSNAAAVASSYFTRQGFDVEMESTAEGDDIIVERETIPPPPPLQRPNVTNITSAGNATNITEALLGIPADVREPSAPVPPAPEPEQQQGIFRKAWTWISSLFS